MGSLGKQLICGNTESVIIKPLRTTPFNKVGLGTRKGGWNFLSICWVLGKKAGWHLMSSFWLMGRDLGLWPQGLKILCTPGNQRFYLVLAVCCLWDPEHREINHCQRGRVPAWPPTPIAPELSLRSVAWLEGWGEGEGTHGGDRRVWW